VPGVAGVLGPLLNVHEPMLRKLPHHLAGVCEECGRGAQQPFVLRPRRRIARRQSSERHSVSFG
jgi:hypothetical protein